MSVEVEVYMQCSLSMRDVVTMVGSISGSRSKVSKIHLGVSGKAG